jgi:hypothetical protein
MPGDFPENESLGLTLIMATYNLIGAPFPKRAPIFASDKGLQRKLAQLESFIEMHHDIREVANYLSTAGKITEGLIHCEQGDIISFYVRDALAVAAIVLYAKLFKSTQGRTVLNKNEVFGDPTIHNSFMDVRDKFLAHQEWNANRHQVFFFQESKSSPIRMNPYGQTTRIPVWPNLDWESFDICKCEVENFLKRKIGGLCKAIEELLTPEQLEFLNTTSSEELIRNHWIEQLHLTKDPFSSRD